MNNFLKRTLSGALFVALIIGSILLSQASFFVVFAIINGWAVYEFHQITNLQTNVSVNKWAAVGAAILLFSCSYIYKSGLIPFPVYWIYGAYIMLVFIAELFYQKENPIHNWAYLLLGQAYIALPFSLLIHITFIQNFQPLILLAVFGSIWVNDTGAYLIGVSLGKHRLFERISPKKSWEGFFGGAFFALISGYVFSIFIPQLSLLNWLLFSEIIVVFGTLGDLTESMLKRTLKVKDSGDVIPGHGGLLDRFDSMLFAAPAIYIFLDLISNHLKN